MNKLTDLSSAQEHIDRALQVSAFSQRVTRDMDKDELLVVIGVCLQDIERQHAAERQERLMHQSFDEARWMME